MYKRQLLGRTYDVARPGVVAIYLTGSLPAGCGPHDVAIALVGKLFKSCLLYTSRCV